MCCYRCFQEQGPLSLHRSSLCCVVVRMIAFYWKASHSVPPASPSQVTCKHVCFREAWNSGIQICKKKKKYSVEERDGYIFQYANVSHHFSLKLKLLLVNLKWDCDKSERSACVYTCTERVTCPHPHVISSTVGAGLSIPPVHSCSMLRA